MTCLVRITRPASALAAFAFVFLTGTPAFSGTIAASRATFDGQWSVLIVTEKGRCDRAYRYPVKIENGAVGYAGSASFNISGSVGNNGAVTVTVSRGSQSATGTRPYVGDRRRRHLDRGFGRMLRHLVRRAPFVGRIASQWKTIH